LADPIKPLRELVAALLAGRLTNQQAASQLGDVLEQVRRLAAPTIPPAWLNPRLEVFERARRSWLAGPQGTPIPNEDLRLLERVVDELRPASDGRIAWNPDRVKPEDVLVHARSVREALRPSLTQATKTEQDFYALIHLKLLERALNPDGLPQESQNGFSGQVVVRRALTDLRDLCYTIAEHWGYTSLWDGQAMATPPPLEMPGLPVELVKRLAKKVRRLGDALARHKGEPSASAPTVPETTTQEPQTARPAHSVATQIRNLMDRFACAHERFLRSTLRLLAVPSHDDLTALMSSYRPDKPPKVKVPIPPLDGLAWDDFLGASTTEPASGQCHHFLALVKGGQQADEAAQHFCELAAESGRLYQTLPPSLAPICMTTAPRNAWATVLCGSLKGTTWVQQAKGYEYIALPFAASAELWRRLLYGTTPDGKVVPGWSPTEQHNPSGAGVKDRVQEDTGDTRSEMSEPPPTQPRWNQWAVGLEAGNKWQLFRRIKGEWRPQKPLRGISRGRQAGLLEAFAERGGCLPKIEALKLEHPNYSAADVDKLMGLIKPELTRLRDALCKAIGVTDPKADPLPFDDAHSAWRSEIEIGYAVRQDGEHVGGENRLRFKSRMELDAHELADR
jgi:hypothetical protein